MKRKYFLFLLLVILITFSCKTFDNNEENAFVLSNILIKDVNELLNQKKYLSAIQSLDYLEKNTNVEKSELKDMKNTSVTGIQELYRESLENNNYKDLLRYYLTLKNISEEAVTGDITEKEIRLNIAREYKEKNDSVAAIVKYLNLLKSDDSNEKDFKEAADYVYELNDSASMRLIISLMEQREFSVDNKYYEITNHQIKASDLMQATVTVWVDKGTKFEDGLGYADRVLGSGFFIDKRGYIITNYHVISTEVDPEYEGFSRLYIKLPNRIEEKIPTKVVGWDPVFDIALLKVEIEPDNIFNIAADVAVEPGDKVFAIGSPLDPLLENTITSGIVSATSRRHFIQLGDVVQIDAPVNPGNSGGPLLNEEGQLVGVVFAGISPYEGLNFAIPSKWIRLIIDDLFDEGIVKHPWLGMVINDTDKGHEVIYTVPGESANIVGIKAGDIITSINNKNFSSIIDIQGYLLSVPVNSLVSVQWESNGTLKSGLLVLNERPRYPMELAIKRDTKANIIYPLFGMKLKEVEVTRWEKRYTVDNIILGSTADNSGISVDDPISLKEWIFDEENRIVFLQIYIKKRTEGYINSAIQIAAFIELDSFI